MSDPDPTDATRSLDSVDGADRPVRDEALLCDVMLGSLVTYLRMCGYDAVYALDRGVEADDRLLEIARDERRTLLTRDRQLARRAQTSDVGKPDNDGSRTDSDSPTAEAGGLLLEARDVTDQLRELRDAGYDLALAERPARCGRCNGPVEPVGENEDTPKYVPDAGIETVWRCVECSQHFWKGSHWDRVERTLADL